MSAHKFHIGQTVRHWPIRGGDREVQRGGHYVVIVRLPQDAAGEFKYRIRNEAHERVAKEKELKSP